QGDFERLYRELELPLAGVLADMERVGVRIDEGLLGRMSAEASAQLKRLEARCHELAGHEFNVGSPRQLETILFDELGLPVVKRTKTGRSTDAQVLEELAAQHELPEAILAHRTLSKLQGTYLEALPAAVHPETGRVHTRYNQAVAATGRLSSSDPNLQNIPIRTEVGRTIRDAFIPAEGCVLLAADYSQIELRVLAHLSEDPELLDAYQTAQDVHRRTASALFDVAPEDVSYAQRNQAKTVNFAVIYGQTQFALARNLKIERSEAKRYIDAFFARYAGVQRFMDGIVEEARGTGYVTTLLGRRRAVNDIRSRNRNLRNAAERIARNTPIQGTAADIIKIAMVRVHARLRAEGLATRMILTVHDELLFEVPEAEREPVGALVRETMESALELRVPLVVDQGWGASWGAAH
ncbi:MAG: DNA polymerase I, partial [Myxococcota bacterium]